MPDTSLLPAAPELASAGEDLLALLERRRSLPPLLLGEPGPSRASLRRMLTIASRVPDHGRLVPWRFILFEGEARAAFGEKIAPIFAQWLDAERAEWCAAEPNRRANAIDTMTRIFTRAPLVVVVVDRADPAARIPAWEQSLTVGAVCMNLINAAAGLGFASVWLSGWLATQQAAWPVLGLAGNERVAGVIHIGTPREAPKERERPDIDSITSVWSAE